VTLVRVFDFIFPSWLVGDGFFPCINTSIQAMNRRKRRLILDLRRSGFQGVVLVFMLFSPLSVDVNVICLPRI
jgi:hypothetical protein